jgi:hypothetical protein
MSVTATFGTAAPDGSEIVPVKAPVPADWAIKDDAKAHSVSSKKAACGADSLLNAMIVLLLAIITMECRQAFTAERLQAKANC